ncbi:MAG TPA: DUF929 family protein [Acidimicrobiales bacterium]|nr:DUF929 family protein [Acidimicrobiales bacterium]
MSAVQAGGGKGSGQKPGSPAGGRPAAGAKPSPGSRGANGVGKTPGRRPAPGTKTSSGGGARGGAGGGGGGKGPKGPGGYRPGQPPARFSASTLAFVAVAVVVVVVVVFVVIKVTGGSSPSTAKNGTQAPKDVIASQTVVNDVTSVPASVAESVGLPSTSTVAPLTVKTGQPPLTIAGKPGAIFIGGEFCPLCAAERWAIVMAFGKFGTFTNLKETTSSPWDSDPATATFSFLGTQYESPYISFSTSEHESNDTTGLGTRTTLEPLTSQESKLWAKYDNPEGFPFLDIGNKYFVLNPSYNPAVLSGLDQQDIASKLKNPKDPVTQDIVGTSNYITAAICAVTGQKPSSVCSAPVVAKAAHALNGS